MMSLLKNPLFVALAALALCLVTNVAQAGRPQTQLEACFEQCKGATDACVRSACEATCASPSGIEFRAGGRETHERSYGNFYEAVCREAPIPVTVVTPPPTTSPVAYPQPNLPPAWLQAAVALQKGTDAVERMAANTDSMRATVESLAAQVDRLKAVRVAQASASRTTNTSSTSAVASTQTDRASLLATWTECQRMKATMEASYVLYAPVLVKCAWVGSELGVH